jgi:hypothetical protein
MKLGSRHHKLLTQEIIKQLPPLYANEGKDPSTIPVIVKFFSPYTNWTWYATEFDGKDTFFGMVHGHEKELGYFSLSELENSYRGALPLVERDLYFGKHMLSEFMPDRGNPITQKPVPSGTDEMDIGGARRYFYNWYPTKRSAISDAAKLKRSGHYAAVLPYSLTMGKGADVVFCIFSDMHGSDENPLTLKGSHPQGHYYPTKEDADAEAASFRASGFRVSVIRHDAGNGKSYYSLLGRSMNPVGNPAGKHDVYGFHLDSKPSRSYVGKMVTIPAGEGYWALGRYPWGGDFRRLSGDLTSMIVEAYDYYSDGTLRRFAVMLPDRSKAGFTFESGRMTLSDKS